MLGSWSANPGELHVRQNGNDKNGNGQNNGPDNSAFTIVNGRIYTPGLGIILAVCARRYVRTTEGLGLTNSSHNLTHLRAAIFCR